MNSQMEGEWRLGFYVCLSWTGCDVMLSTASIMHLCSIALYRYHGIANPLEGRKRKGLCRLVVPAWLVGGILLVPFVLQACHDTSNVLEIATNATDFKASCGIFNRLFATCSSLVSFFIPLMVMTVVEILSIQTLRKRNHLKCISKLASSISSSYYKQQDRRKSFDNFSTSSTPALNEKFKNEKLKINSSRSRLFLKTILKRHSSAMETRKGLFNLPQRQKTALLAQQLKGSCHNNSQQHEPMPQNKQNEYSSNERRLCSMEGVQQKLQKPATDGQKTFKFIRNSSNSSQTPSIKSSFCMQVLSKSSTSTQPPNELQSKKQQNKKNATSDKTQKCFFVSQSPSSTSKERKSGVCCHTSTPSHSGAYDIPSSDACSANETSSASCFHNEKEFDIHKAKTPTDQNSLCHRLMSQTLNGRSTSKSFRRRKNRSITKLKRHIFKKYPAQTTLSIEERQDDTALCNRSRYRKARSTSLVIIEMLASGREGFRSTGRERRAEKTLIWVFLIFVLLWMPFFTTNLVYGLCSLCDVPPLLFHIFTWLGYLSSGVNPAIYTLLNRDFRMAFQNILCCKTFYQYLHLRKMKRNQTHHKPPSNLSNTSLSFICQNRLSPSSQSGTRTID